MSGKAEEARKPPGSTQRIELLADSTEFHPTAGRLMRAGDVVELPGHRAVELIDSGAAVGFALIRATREGVIVGSRVMAAGEELEVSARRVPPLVARGLIQVVREAPGKGGAPHRGPKKATQR